MIVVIIAGGSGTRLWPLSTPEYPKHLLKINGDHKSLLQNTFERAKRLSSDIYVVTDASHVQHVKDQLPELSEEAFITEPARRGTASCIIAALVHIKGRHDPKDPIAFLAADHFIRNTEGFVRNFKDAGDVSREEGKIVLVGVEPTTPSTQFGYIKKADLFDKKRYVYQVDSFKEKPDFATAKAYLKSGNYLWNCGYFVGSVGTFQQDMQASAPLLAQEYQDLAAAASPEQYQETYLTFDSASIDYALMEKLKDLLVVHASFDWMDVGSYHDLHKAVERDEQGNHFLGKQIETHQVENSFIQNYEDKPVAVVGLDNVVVVNTKDGLLVARKDLAKQIGDISKRFNKS
jgi:mannose-1-phosphate guanylyltransferase/mannose-6-phosphate isomerase